MPYPKEWWDAEKESRGKLWRGFMVLLHPHSEIGCEAVTDLVAFYCAEARSLSNKSCNNANHAKMQDDLENLKLGLDVWHRYADELALAVARHDKIPLQEALGRARQEWYSGECHYEVQVNDWMLILAKIHKEVRPGRQLHSRGESRRRDLVTLGIELRRNLHYTLQIETFRDIARKTWPADPKQRQHWTYEELDFVSGYYDQQQPYYLQGPERNQGGSVDPQKIIAQRLGYPFCSSYRRLSHVLGDVLCAVAIDFVDELLAFNEHHSVKGSFCCQECGQFIPRSFYGRGQLYCSAQCKRRAAKARQRAKASDQRERQAWAERAIDI